MGATFTNDENELDSTTLWRVVFETALFPTRNPCAWSFLEDASAMAEIKLFRINGLQALEVPTSTRGLEKSLQVLLENNLEPILAVKFLRSEYSTGKNHGGRIDTLGIDENLCPVIIEYKRAVNENVINQGLFYLDWLLDHKAEFKLLVMDSIGKIEAAQIDWSGVRLICISGDFTKYDLHAVKQINRNIDLLRYRRFGTDLIAMELVHRTSASGSGDMDDGTKAPKGRKSGDKPVSQWLVDLDPPMRDLYESLRAFILALGDDLQEKQLKLYVAFRRIKNFACVVFQKRGLLLYLRLNPDTVTLEEGFTRDVRSIGHWATGDLEVTIVDEPSLRKAESLLVRSYEEA
jgi:predicted transport protein